MARAPSTKPIKEEPLEKQLWKAADKLRKSIDAAEYKHVVRGLIFLKCISNSFEEIFSKLKARQNLDPASLGDAKARRANVLGHVAEYKAFIVAEDEPAGEDA